MAEVVRCSGIDQYLRWADVACGDGDFSLVGARWLEKMGSRVLVVTCCIWDCQSLRARLGGALREIKFTKLGTVMSYFIQDYRT